MLQLKINHELPALTIDIDISLPSTGITALFGHSGSGKSTILRILAGLEANLNVIIRFNQKPWQDEQLFVPPHKRNIGYMFQDVQLFKHLNVAKNLFFASKRSKVPETMVNQICHDLNITYLMNRMPNRLSGGEKQLIGLARCLLTQPEILLLDEPLSALDNARKIMVLEYLHKLPIPIILVSHSLIEVSKIADYLVYIENGKLIEHGQLNQVLPTLEKIESLGSINKALLK